MQPVHRRKLFALPLIAAGLLAVLFPAKSRAAEVCQPLEDSTLKVLFTPSHLYENSTSNGQTRSTEAIYLGNDIYLLMSGKWKKSSFTRDAMVKQEKENWADKIKMSCRLVREEMVGGVPTTVYTMHSENDAIKQDGQIWLAKSTGLPVKEELDQDAGGGPSGKSHRSIRFEYTNVKAPI